MQVLWIDHHYDTERAEEGANRYDAHIQRNMMEFAGSFGDIAPVAFACTAWRLSVSAALSPGYVRWHRRILSVACVRNQWDGTLTAQVMLVSPWPAALAWPREWCRDRGWRDWPNVLGQFVHPTQRDVATTAYLRASLLIEAPVPFDGLPPAPEDPHDAVAETARRAVAVLVRELNDLLAPIIEKLESGVPIGLTR
jgi:hypothetical protein